MNLDHTFLRFARTPSAARYMTLALVPKRVRKRAGFAPSIRAEWRNFIPSGYYDDGSETVHPITLQAASLRPIMAILTHPRFPVPIWNILQVRNVITQHRACPADAPLSVVAYTIATRILPKGAEFDLAVRISGEGEPVFESISTFYVRGRFAGEGEVDEEAPVPQPEPPSGTSTAWRMERRGALSYARLTGDYNGVHLFHSYARMLGFRSAFAHPHRVLQQILSRVPGYDPSAPQRVTVWFKGPVLYRKEVTLSLDSGAQRTAFALRLPGDPRPAILGTVEPLR